jgi:hypothetical protein
MSAIQYHNNKNAYSLLKKRNDFQIGGSKNLIEEEKSIPPYKLSELKSIKLNDKSKFTEIIKTIDKIPTDRVIEKKDINKMTDDDIVNLTHYVAIEYPNKNPISPLYHKYDMSTLENAIDTYFLDNSLIFAPGDSPFKPITVMKLLFMNEDGKFIINGKIKNIKFIDFAFSRPESYAYENYDIIYDQFKIFMGQQNLILKDYNNYIFF